MQCVMCGRYTPEGRQACKGCEGGFYMIKEGSTVKHLPTGETWYLLGVNKKRNNVCVAGYPPSIAELKDCVLIDKGEGITEEELVYRNKMFGTNWD